ncbi:amidase domain-containing protein [Streptomyces sp. NPDC018057]|uniref:amidase domain-containing protein n=2 Tax=Streptomyces TaxID=1883 RepID=UPI0037884F04
MPRSLETGGTDTLTPLLSGLVASPEQGRVRAEFALRDENGGQLPGVTVPEAWVDSGHRAAARVPEGALKNGTTYLWAMRSCTAAGCSAWSYEEELTVSATAPPAPKTTTVTLTGAALEDATAPIGAGTCAGGCPAVEDTRLTLGGAADSERAVWFRPGLGQVPAGARVTRARLQLTPAECGTAACAARPVEITQLGEAWAAPQDGADLPDLLEDTPFGEAALPEDQDLGPMVQSWLEQGPVEGFVLRLPAKDRGRPLSYHSSRSADAAKRPRLVIEYVAPKAPGAPEDLRVTPGDGGLLATWNPPADPGSATDGAEYDVVVTRADGTVAARTTTREPRAVIGALADGTPYRVAVTARTAHGSGPAATAGPGTPAAVPGGTATYRDIVQQYLDARAAILRGTRPTAAAALAAAPAGAAFQDLLNGQAADLVETRESLARHGTRYTEMTSTLSEVLAGVDDSGAVFLRAVVDDRAVLGGDGAAAEPEEGRREQRFTFSTNSGAPLLHLEADAPAAEKVLSRSAAVEDGLDVAGEPEGPLEETPEEPVELDAEGFPVQTPQAAGAMARAAQVSGSGTANWASRNLGTKWEYGQDCTNFVSKALYYGGKMKTRAGGRKHDRAWWQQYYFFGTVKNKSYTWSGAENFRRHMINYRKAQFVHAHNARAGDIVLFKWKKERAYNHVAVVSANRHGVQLLQHGGVGRTSLAAAIARYRKSSNYIERVIILRPRSRG